MSSWRCGIKDGSCKGGDPYLSSGAPRIYVKQHGCAVLLIGKDVLQVTYQEGYSNNREQFADNGLPFRYAFTHASSRDT
jgi:hypothetical protein